MKLFIKVKNGGAVEHPITEDNLIASFPNIDMEDLPPEFAKFVRVAKPHTGQFEVYEGATYEWNGWAFTDVHHVRPMTSEEKQEVVNKIKSEPPSANWRWDEEKLIWLPPLRPTTVGPWKFDFQAKDWVVATEPPFSSWVLSEDGTHYTAPIPRPQDGQRYRWDEPTLSWVLVDV